MSAALDLTKDTRYGHIKPIKRRAQFLEFCRYLRSSGGTHTADIRSRTIVTRVNVA